MNTTPVPPEIDATIKPLVHALGGHDALDPSSARRALEAIGPGAVPSLIGALRHPSPDARWEAAKALATIADPTSVRGLVEALDDEDGGVRWIASQALCHIGPDSLPLLLAALVHHSDSVWLREGAHHVMRLLASEELAPVLRPVLEAIRSIEPAIGVMAAADRALARVEAILAARTESLPGGAQYMPRGPTIHVHGAWRHIASRPGNG